MTERQIRAEYQRLFSVLDDAQKTQRLQELRVQADQADPPIWVQLIDARIALAGKQYDKAIKLSTSVLEDPQVSADVKSFACYNRGMAYGLKGEYDKAMKDFTEVIGDPSAPAEQRFQARFNRGVAYGRKDEHDKAIADYTPVIDDPSAPAEQRFKAHVNRGFTFGQRNESNKAIADYEAVIRDSAAPADIRERASLFRASLKLSPKAAQAVNELPVEIDKKTREEFKKALEDGRRRKEYFFNPQSQFAPDASFLLVLREWNSYTPAIPDEGEPARGGGYFIKHKQIGIVIDPGFDFIEIFSEAGGRLCDITDIVVTHAHNDHTAELEAILTLLYEFNDKYKEEPDKQKRVNLYLSQGAARKFSGFLQLRRCSYLAEVLTLNRGRKEHPQVVQISKDITLIVIPAYHDDIVSKDYAVGLGFEIRFDSTVRRLLFTGDTSVVHADEPKTNPLIHEAYTALFDAPDGIDLLVAHIGSIEDSELQGPLGKLSGEERRFTPEKTFYDKHLGLRGTFVVLQALRPKSAVISEFGEEMKAIWIEAVEVIGRILGEVLQDVNQRVVPVFAGDPLIIYNIQNHEFLCHEDRQFHEPNDLTMLPAHGVDKDGKAGAGPVRPYLFCSGQHQKVHKAEDKIAAFHKAMKQQKLPHFVSSARH